MLYVGCYNLILVYGTVSLHVPSKRGSFHLPKFIMNFSKQLNKYMNANNPNGLVAISRCRVALSVLRSAALYYNGVMCSSPLPVFPMHVTAPRSDCTC